MEDDGSHAAVLKLLMEDLEEIEAKRKGKCPARQESDFDLALKCMGEFIEATQTSIDDQALALSTSEAIVTDQRLLASFQHEERASAQDRRYALGLHHGRQDPVNSPPASGRSSPEDSGNAVSMVMEDLMDRMITSKETSKGNEPSGMHSSQTHSLMKDCASCWEKVEGTMFNVPCGHGFCRECTKQMFLGAIKDEELYPPRCCGNILSPGIALRLLDYQELRAFCDSGLEWTAKGRLYCADATCSKFIPPFAIRDQHGTCPECHRQTHVPCRSLEHPGVDCPMDENLHAVLEMAGTQSWKRCFNCRTMVELRHGCNHITCRCGQEFCYACGLVWKSCECPLWHENRLEDVAVQAVEDEVPPNANVEVRQIALNRIREDLRNHQDGPCEHFKNSQWVWRSRGRLRCDICDFCLPEYIFVCRNCRMRACNNCRRHRLR